MTPARRAIHIASERAALYAGVPFLVWASYQTTHPLARAGLRAFAVASFLVDGWLLRQWRGNTTARFAALLARRAARRR